MSEQQVPPDPELTEIEAALGSLSPAPSRSRLDRDRLMFQSGQVAPRPPALARWAWPSIAATLALVSLAEAAALATRPATRVVERLVVVREPEAAPRVTPGPSGLSPGDPSPRASEPVPVVILRQSPTPHTTGDAEFAPASWSTPSGSEPLRRWSLRPDLDGLPEPPPLVFQPGGPALDPAPEASGALLRSEIARLLNPGEPS